MEEIVDDFHITFRSESELAFFKVLLVIKMPFLFIFFFPLASFSVATFLLVDLGL